MNKVTWNTFTAEVYDWVTEGEDWISFWTDRSEGMSENEFPLEIRRVVTEDYIEDELGYAMGWQGKSNGVVVLLGLVLDSVDWKDIARVLRLDIKAAKAKKG